MQQPEVDLLAGSAESKIDWDSLRDDRGVSLTL